MIEKFEDLELTDDIDTTEKVDIKLQEKLGLSVASLQDILSKWLLDNAETLTLDFANIAPLGNYENLLEDNDGMANFLKSEAHKPEHWILHAVRMSPNDKHNLIVFDFVNKAVDDGDVLKGLVFVSLQGKVKHVFAQGDV